MSEFIKGCSPLKPLSPATFTSDCIVACRAAQSRQNRLSGHYQSQVINTLLRKLIGLAAGREGLGVPQVAKLKITFISPF